jgi:hypothetical protein
MIKRSNSFCFSNGTLTSVGEKRGRDGYISFDCLVVAFK